MKISGNALRPGNVIRHMDKIWVVVSVQHTQPGKGGAYMCVVLRDIHGGTKKDERFRAAESVERLFIEEQEYEFLYQDGEEYVLMHPETYDQVSLPGALFTPSSDFLQQGMKIKIGFYDQVAVFATLPARVVLKVEQADPSVKGQTASSSYKHAELSNGRKILVPTYIEGGTLVVVNTEDGTYVERYKE